MQMWHINYLNVGSDSELLRKFLYSKNVVFLGTMPKYS